MQHQLASAGPKSVRRDRQARGLAWVVVLCLLLLIGCAGPEKVADQQSDAPPAAPISSAPDEQTPPPVETEPPAMAASPVDAPVVPVAPPEVPEPPVAPAAETDVQPASHGPMITFANTVHDFGQVNPRSRSVCEFKFKNTGTETLTLARKIDSTCGCTTPVLAKTDYAPGEEGVIKVTYAASSIAATARKYMTVHSNDPEHPTVKLTITAKITPRVASEPKQLNLTLRDNAKSCPPITLRSLDGAAFSVTHVVCTGNAITAEFDPAAEATEFTIQPTLDMEKLPNHLTGYLVFVLTHPECKEVRIRYQMRSGFQFTPASLVVFNAKPSLPVQRDVWLSNNYGEDFEIAALSSERNIVEVTETKKVAAQNGEGTRYHLRVSITPPAGKGKNGIFTDTLSVRLGKGPTLKLLCRGFYAAPRAATQYPPP